MKPVRILVFLATVAAAGSAQAAGLGVRAGTTGVGADFGWDIAPTVSARIGYSGYSRNTHVDSDDVSYDARLKLSNLSLLFDFSPLGPFRFTTGLVADQNKYTLNGKPNGGTYTINGHTYLASEVGSLSGTVKPGNSIAPYFGFGYGNVAGKGVNFYWDVGVIYQGSPKTSLSATCGVPARCAQLQSDTEAEQQRVDDKLKRFKYYPVANIGVTVGF
jgi:hypothetical protein